MEKTRLTPLTQRSVLGLVASFSDRIGLAAPFAIKVQPFCSNYQAFRANNGTESVHQILQKSSSTAPSNCRHSLKLQKRKNSTQVQQTK